MTEQEQKIRIFTISSHQRDIRLDQWLRQQLPSLSRSFIQKQIKNGQVLVNDKPVKVHHIIKGGEEVKVIMPPPEKPELEPEAIPLNIVFEDEHILVINKPPGIVVHPAPGVNEHTLVNAIIHHCPGLAGVGGEKRPGIVHRLDKGTSGLMIVAKSPAAHQELVRQLTGREINKKYLALLLGEPAQDQGIINAPIGRSLVDRKKMSVNLINGREAKTEYKVSERLDGFCLVEADLHTGRTHQIRVHFCHIGYPVLGDTTYGPTLRSIADKLPSRKTALRQHILELPRQMLHAKELTVQHPITGKPLTFSSPLPGDFSDMLKILQTNQDKA